MLKFSFRNILKYRDDLECSIIIGYFLPYSSLAHRKSMLSVIHATGPAVLTSTVFIYLCSVREDSFACRMTEYITPKISHAHSVQQ